MGTFSIKTQRVIKDALPILPTASTLGMFNTSDIGKRLLMASSNTAAMAIGTTADFAKAAGILGIFVGFQDAGTTNSTAGSTTPIMYLPILQGEVVEANFSTTFSTALPATTDIGKYISFSNTTTLAGAADLDMGTVGNGYGTTSACFLKITGFDVLRRQIRGTINSTHLAL
jgi:hypothetical protein